MMFNKLKKHIPKPLKNFLADKYYLCLYNYQVYKFDRYRSTYDKLTLKEKKVMAGEWLKKYPEQSHFNYQFIENWLKKVTRTPVNILEIGGWRGDLAELVLSSFRNIVLWHNYDLLEWNEFQKCNDERYKLITLDDYLWRTSLKFEYNALIATHMIEHIKWRELKELINWIPPQIETVLFEAPLPASAENFNWKGDHSSHILEKGWEQVTREMEKNGFSVEFSEENSYIFGR